MLELIRSALNNGKGADLTVLPVERQSSGLFSHMVIVTALSSRHVAALAARTLKALKNGGYQKPSLEASDDWTLIDCGAIVVQIMQEEARQHYRLEELWGFEGTGEIETG